LPAPSWRATEYSVRKGPGKNPILTSWDFSQDIVKSSSAAAKAASIIPFHFRMAFSNMWILAYADDYDGWVWYFGDFSACNHVGLGFSPDEVPASTGTHM
jgi:hypothetical protein